MRIEHIAMYVRDLEKARDFFVSFLEGKPNEGYHNVKTGFRSYFISFEDGCRLELMEQVFSVAEKQKHPLTESCCTMLMYNLGYPINFIEGGINNIKIVREEDLTVFSALVK